MATNLRQKHRVLRDEIRELSGKTKALSENLKREKAAKELLVEIEKHQKLLEDAIGYFKE